MKYRWSKEVNKQLNIIDNEEYYYSWYKAYQDEWPFKTKIPEQLKSDLYRKEGKIAGLKMAVNLELDKKLFS